MELSGGGDKNWGFHIRPLPLSSVAHLWATAGNPRVASGWGFNTKKKLIRSPGGGKRSFFFNFPLAEFAPTPRALLLPRLIAGNI